VQLALDDPALDEERRRELQARERELQTAHQAEWLGMLAPLVLEHQDVHVLAFRRGWVDTLEIDHLTLHLARALRDAPQARLLRQLEIADAFDDITPPLPDDNVPEDEDEPGFWALVGSPNLANVRFLRLGIDEGDDYREFNDNPSVTCVAPLVRSMPNLEELRVFVKHHKFTDLLTLPTLKHLRVLQIYNASGVHRLDVLAANPAFRHLTHLLLHPHHIEWHMIDDDYDFHEAEGYIPLSVVRALLHSPNVPHLTHLRLRLSSLGDVGCREIVASGILKRLRFLDLRHGRVTDAGARLLADCPDSRNLEWLDLSYNSLSPAGVQAIEGVAAGGEFGDQHDPRQAAQMTGREEYLTEGDFE
jgi:hypothetical protein